MEATIGTLNIAGIRRKIKNLQNLLYKDKVAVQETKLAPNSSLQLAGYNSYRKDVTSRKHGVALFIKTNIPSLNHQLPQELDHLQAIAADIFLPIGKITIINYYNPPTEELNEEVFHYADALANAVILGDFNARSQNLNDHRNNANGNILENILLGTVLVHVFNEELTFLNAQGNSIPDHILHSPSLTHLFADAAHIGTTVTSDHSPVLVTFDGFLLDDAPQYISIKDYKNANWSAITAALDEYPTATNCASQQDIDSYLTNYTETIQRVLNEYTPTKTINTHRPILPPYIVDCIREKRYLRRQYIRTRDPYYKTQINRLRAYIRQQSNRYHANKWKEAVISMDYRNAASFWKLFNRLTQRKKVIDSATTYQRRPDD